MALYFNMWSLVVKRSALEARYPGGLRAFAENHIGEDQLGYVDAELVRLGAMGAGDFALVFSALESHGILVHRPDRPGDAALGTEDNEIFLATPWLVFGTYRFLTSEVDEASGLWRGKCPITVPALRLAGGTDASLVMPSWSTSTQVPGTGWTPWNHRALPPEGEGAEDEE